MRLLKLIAYCLIGYLIYEFWQGMRDEDGTTGRAKSRGEVDDLNLDPAHAMNMTGPARGTTIETEDASGATSPHLVGRGVVSR